MKYVKRSYKSEVTKTNEQKAKLQKSEPTKRSNKDKNKNSFKLKTNSRKY